MKKQSIPMMWAAFSMWFFLFLVCLILALAVGGWLWLLPVFSGLIQWGLWEELQKQRRAAKERTSSFDSTRPEQKPNVIERSLSPMRSVMTEKELARESRPHRRELTEWERDHLSTGQGSSPSRSPSASAGQAEPRKRRRRLARIEFSYVDAEGQHSHRQVNVFAVDAKHFEGYCLLAQATRTFLIARVVDDIVDLDTGEIVDVQKWVRQL